MRRAGSCLADGMLGQLLPLSPLVRGAKFMSTFSLCLSYGKTRFHNSDAFTVWCWV